MLRLPCFQFGTLVGWLVGWLVGCLLACLFVCLLIGSLGSVLFSYLVDRPVVLFRLARLSVVSMLVSRIVGQLVSYSVDL
jgi:hypothetical protein